MSLTSVIEGVLGAGLPVAVTAYDGSRVGPEDAPATIVIRSKAALRRILTAPGELGFARAYVAGDIDVEGDIYAALSLRDRLPNVRLTPRQWVTAARAVGLGGLRPLAPPAEEAHLRGRVHSPARDAAAIAHHYDVSNRFYELVLGPSLTYSCAVWTDPDVGLDAAQEAKYDLICRKLSLSPGQRLLDVGCGWGGMVLHAARHYGVRAVGVTLSRRQADLAAKRMAEAGVGDRVQVRYQDYREIDEGPYDAISSIGMFEHVGVDQLAVYFRVLHRLLTPGGRLLNHGISRPATERAGAARGSFIDRYVFPDGELLDVGETVKALHEAGFEAHHMESLRAHYALTLRAWVSNLEAHWDEAVDEVGAARARVWRLYMAGSALNFETNRTQIHQVLATRTAAHPSGMPLRPDWGA